MNHILLTSKIGRKVLLHKNVIKEAFDAADGEHSICFLDIINKDGNDAVMYVKETPEQIYALIDGKNDGDIDESEE